MTDATDFTLLCATHRGERVVTFTSMISALTKIADDYDADGEPAIAEAFRLFAQSLVSEALSTR